MVSSRHSSPAIRTTLGIFTSTEPKDVFGPTVSVERLNSNKDPADDMMHEGTDNVPSMDSSFDP